MLQFNETEHEVWQIRTVTGIDNPDDWKRGDPDRYFVRGIAEFPHDGPHPQSYASTDPITAESERFTDASQAPRLHAEVTAQLVDLIEERRHFLGW